MSGSQSNAQSRVVSIKDLAKELNVSTATAWRRYRDGETPPRIGKKRSIVFLRSDIEFWFENHCPSRVVFLKLFKQSQFNKKRRK